MLNKWYGMASYCSDNGICRHTGTPCRPNNCPLSASVYTPDEDHDEKKTENVTSEV